MILSTPRSPEGRRTASSRTTARFRFRDVTREAGVGDRRYANGVAVGDYDNDGDSDLLVTNFGRNTLYHNRSDTTFEDVTEEAGLTREGYHTSAVWFDLGGDGDLDIYIARYLDYDPRLSRPCREGGQLVYCHPRLLAGQPDALYENLGDGRFSDVSSRAGIARAGPDEGKGLGVIAWDFDRDGRTDIYVANDTTPNFLWHQNSDGTFTDVAPELGVALSDEGTAQAGMGVDWGDVDGDGRFDLHVTNFSRETNNLYLSLQDGRFRDAVRGAGLGESFLHLGFGTLLGDFDLDGDLDIAVANGHVDDLVERTASGTTYRQQPSFYANDGAGRFRSARDLAGPVFREHLVGRGLAGADMDGDGDVDLALMTLDRGLLLLRNRTRGRNYLTIQLLGKRPRDAYGSRVGVRAGSKEWTYEYQSARSYLSATDPRLTIGLGDAERVERITVRWPSGSEVAIEGVEANQTLIIREE